MIDMPYIWLIVTIIMTLMEIATSQLVSIWFVFGAVAALITSIFIDSIFSQVLVFIVITFACLVLTRPFIKKTLNFKKEETNANSYIGKEGIVTEKINNEMCKGQVNVKGSIWTARSIDDTVIEEGEKVVVEKIEGVKLIVKSFNK